MMYRVPPFPIFSTGNGSDLGSLLSRKAVKPTCSLLENLLPKNDFNSAIPEWITLLILYPVFSNWRVRKSGPLLPIAEGWAGRSLKASRKLYVAVSLWFLLRLKSSLKRPLVLSASCVNPSISPVSYPYADLSRSDTICISEASTRDTFAPVEPLFGTKNEPRSDRCSISRFAKKNTLFFTIGPPRLNPVCNCFRSPLNISTPSTFPPVMSLFLKKPNTVPFNSLVPDFVTALMDAPVNPDCVMS